MGTLTVTIALSACSVDVMQFAMVLFSKPSPHTCYVHRPVHTLQQWEMRPLQSIGSVRSRDGEKCHARTPSCCLRRRWRRLVCFVSFRAIAAMPSLVVL